ncbi:MAG: DMT family transporter, partial [Cyanobacteriota bacterium]
MAHPIQLPERSLGSTPTLATIASLCLALLSIASAAIFIKFSEQEISPYATAFNRFWITTVILGLWSGVIAVRRQQEDSEMPQSSPYTGAMIGQLFLVGLFLAADLILWAWSLTQTSVANATLLANLTPVFSCLGGWLVCRRRFDQQFLLGMVIAIAAIFAIGLNDCQIASGKFLGDIAALMAALCFSVYLSVLERLQSQLGATKI